MTREPAAHRYGWESPDHPNAHEYLAPAVESVLRRVVASDLRVLDIGCGNGSMARRLASRGYLVTAFDVAEDGLEQARSIPSPVTWAVGSIYDDDLGERLGTDFSSAISLEVVEHLYFPRRLFEAARQCLRTRGTLIVSTPYHGYAKNLALAICGAWDRHLSVGWDGGHIKFFSRQSLRELAQNAGFREVSFRGVGRLPYLWKSMVIEYQRL